MGAVQLAGLGGIGSLRLVDIERQLTLPSVAPVTGWRAATRLARELQDRLDVATTTRCTRL
jgi:hypothetical protein